MQDAAVTKRYSEVLRVHEPTLSVAGLVSSSSLEDAKRIAELEEEVETLKVGSFPRARSLLLSFPLSPSPLTCLAFYSPLCDLLGILEFDLPGGPRTRSNSPSTNLMTRLTRLRAMTVPSSTNKSTSTTC